MKKAASEPPPSDIKKPSMDRKHVSEEKAEGKHSWKRSAGRERDRDRQHKYALDRDSDHHHDGLDHSREGERDDSSRYHHHHRDPETSEEESDYAFIKVMPKWHSSR